MKGRIRILTSALEALIDTIVPLKARTARTKVLTAEDIPLTPSSHDLLGVRITTLTDYENPVVTDLVQSLKYDGSGHAAHLLASALADYLRDELASELLFSQKRTLLIPVPLHVSRKRERGFNQIAAVLDALPVEFRTGPTAWIETSALERTRPTKQQTRLSRQERLSNVAGAFAITDPDLVAGARVYLIDDVTTTGATLANAATPLRHAGARVTLLALARA